jgi:hypothetical protein
MAAYYLTPSQQTQNPLAGLAFHSSSQPHLIYNNPGKKTEKTRDQLMREALTSVNPGQTALSRRPMA